MNITQEERCNLLQVQNGLMKLCTPSFVKLTSSSNPFVLKTNRTANKLTTTAFKGCTEITNNGEQLVAYKIMSKFKAKLVVKPTYGFIEQGETVRLQVIAKSALSAKHVVNENLSIVIFATTCEVIDPVVTTDLRSFWNGIMHNWSYAFVEVLEISHFQLYNANHHLIAQTGVNCLETDEDDNNEFHSSSTNEDNNNNNQNNDFHEASPFELESLASISSSNYLLQQSSSENEAIRQASAEASGDCSSHSSVKLKGVPNKPIKLTVESIVGMKKLPKGLNEWDKSLSKICACFVIFIVASYYVFMQKSFQKVQSSIQEMSDYTW